jgi:hypothetical protein
MRRPETKAEKGMEILCDKPIPQTKSMKDQCIGLSWEFDVVKPFFYLPLAPSVE